MHKFAAFPVPKPVRMHTIRSRMHKVFVYGTLKRGEPNNYWLTDPKNGIGNYLMDGQTKTRYPLIIATRYNIPFLLHSPGTGHHVQGEVYEVDDCMLAKLDILEDHPNYYVREKDDIQIKNKISRADETVKCWVYFLKNFNPELMQRKQIVNYSSAHGLPYMDRSKRDPLYNPKKDLKVPNCKTSNDPESSK